MMARHRGEVGNISAYDSLPIGPHDYRYSPAATSQLPLRMLSVIGPRELVDVAILMQKVWR